MRKYHFFYLITIGCLLIFNGILFRYAKSLQADVYSASAQIDDGYMDDVVRSIYHYLTIDGSVLSDTLQVTSFVDMAQGIDDKTSYLTDILSDDNIICYYPFMVCHTCLEKQLIKLDNLRRLGKKQNIIVLTDFVTDNIPLFFYKNNIRLQLYTLKNKLNISLPEETIILFRADKNRIKSSFVVNTQTEKYDHYFYDQFE